MSWGMCWGSYMNTKGTIVTSTSGFCWRMSGICLRRGGSIRLTCDTSIVCPSTGPLCTRSLNYTPVPISRCVGVTFWLPFIPRYQFSKLHTCPISRCDVFTMGLPLIPRYQFSKLLSGSITDKTVKYDYTSVMHYGRNVSHLIRITYHKDDDFFN